MEVWTGLIGPQAESTFSGPVVAHLWRLKKSRRRNAWASLMRLVPERKRRLLAGCN